MFPRRHRHFQSSIERHARTLSELLRTNFLTIIFSKMHSLSMEPTSAFSPYKSLSCNNHLLYRHHDQDTRNNCTDSSSSGEDAQELPEDLTIVKSPRGRKESLIKVRLKPTISLTYSGSESCNNNVGKSREVVVNDKKSTESMARDSPGSPMSGTRDIGSSHAATVTSGAYHAIQDHPATIGLHGTALQQKVMEVRCHFVKILIQYFSRRLSLIFLKFVFHHNRIFRKTKSVYFQIWRKVEISS